MLSRFSPPVSESIFIYTHTRSVVVAICRNHNEKALQRDYTIFPLLHSLSRPPKADISALLFALTCTTTMALFVITKFYVHSSLFFFQPYFTEGGCFWLSESRISSRSRLFSVLCCYFIKWVSANEAQASAVKRHTTEKLCVSCFQVVLCDASSRMSDDIFSPFISQTNEINYLEEFTLTFAELSSYHTARHVLLESDTQYSLARALWVSEERKIDDEIHILFNVFFKITFMCTMELSLIWVICSARRTLSMSDEKLMKMCSACMFQFMLFRLSHVFFA